VFASETGRPFGAVRHRLCPVSFALSVWAERRPDRAQAVMALICWSFSSSMLRYLLVDHSLPAM
jgi:hypothetical protein